MFAFLVSALLVVCPVIAITLPNGFTFDEKLYLKIEPRLDYALESCDNPFGGCSNDCSSLVYCNGNIVDKSNSCNEFSPYCVKNSRYVPMCTGNFPMTSQACLTKAMNNFICSEDGQFPDPTDCTKYHVCNGTTHSIVECPSSHYYTYDPIIEEPYVNPGSGEFRCWFQKWYRPHSCDRFYWQANAFTFRSSDFFHYAYCIQVGTQRKMFMFKCPPGTRHNGSLNAGGSVDCVPFV